MSATLSLFRARDASDTRARGKLCSGPLLPPAAHLSLCTLISLQPQTAEKILSLVNYSSLSSHYIMFNAKVCALEVKQESIYLLFCNEPRKCIPRSKIDIKRK